jgi:tRNA A37 methylthiotransferase MiaB
VETIVDEVRQLSDQGFKEVVLLGQNVNSYNYIDESTEVHGPPTLTPGFSSLYKTKKSGIRFTELIDRVSRVNPEMRIRFTSPHPKDFPDELIDLIRERPNVCNALHIPAQSGSTSVLERMRRGYTREAYIELVTRIRDKLGPGEGTTRLSIKIR